MDLVKSILNKWIEIVNYDGDQTRFNLLSSNFAFHECGKRIEQLLKYDTSGIFACLYAKASFESICKDLSCKLIDLLKDPAGINDYQDMWNTFNCHELLEIENSAIKHIIQMTSFRPVIGESDNITELEIFRDSIEYVAEELPKCNTECFSMVPGTIIKDDIKFMTSLLVFNTTSECVLNLEQKPDGMYLCYITDFNSCGGYFAYILKSGKNMLSINDRIDESYTGAHTRFRNNRFIEHKNWHMFPYNDIVSESNNRDYLGYTKSLVCEIKSKEITELSTKCIYPIMLTAVLILQRYHGASIDNIVDNKEVCQVYIDSLLRNNIVSEEVSAILPVPIQDSLICTTNTNIPMYNFTSDNVSSNELNAKYNYKQGNRSKYTGIYGDANKLLVELYGHDFVLNSTDVMKRNWPEITDGNSDTITSEFIGPKDKIELEYYRQCRIQLRDHIIQGMQEAYQDAGGHQGVIDWYKNSICNNISYIIDMAVDFYLKLTAGQAKSFETCDFAIPESNDMLISLRTGEEAHFGVLSDFVINSGMQNSKKYSDAKYQFYSCPVTGNTANMWFIFTPNTYSNIEKLAGDEVPKILKGFSYSGDHSYAGNSILDSCDPVGFIHNPFECRTPIEYNKLFPNCSPISFNLALGLSKRGLNKLIKDRMNR